MAIFVRKLIAIFFLLIMCHEAMAAFLIDRSRYIYEEGRKNISFSVTNQSDKTYGGQVWIDNAGAGDGVYMIMNPSFFKLGSKEKQVIRISRVDTPLPEDRESLFWINTQEIPPKPEVTGNSGSVVSVAVNTRLKLIWRPSSLTAGRKDAEKNLSYRQQDGQTWLINKTPYYFAIVEIKDNGKSVRLGEQATEAVSRIAPFAEIPLGNKLSGRVSVTAVNDNGGVEEFILGAPATF
ncbi:fimbrial chaperone [Escherichia coli]|uniref:fimbrial chaperone n=1 Tax=Escherichia coli TaxID=562 RepID=UPI003F8B4E10